ncbi:hypothetical protein ZWY2020_039805 [Hordeum vulgare]|nr:hypothetical protein ZWY2020_039805 [Hordeum vulgare]
MCQAQASAVVNLRRAHVVGLVPGCLCVADSLDRLAKWKNNDDHPCSWLCVSCDTCTGCMTSLSLLAALLPGRLLPCNNLLGSARPRRRAPRPRAASGYGAGGISEEDAFTRCSRYLFEEGLATEGDLPTAYDIPGIAIVYGRPLLVLRRSLQIGTSFGRWFALRYLDSLNERAADMFEIRVAKLRRILLELCPVCFLF